MNKLLTLFEEPVTLCEELPTLQEKNTSCFSARAISVDCSRQGDLGQSPGPVESPAQDQSSLSPSPKVRAKDDHRLPSGDLTLLRLLALGLPALMNLTWVGPGSRSPGSAGGRDAVGGQLVQVEQALVDAFSRCRYLAWPGVRSPTKVSGILMSRKGEWPYASVLQEHQALGCLAVLRRAEQEEAEVLQAHIITVGGQKATCQALEGGGNSRAVYARACPYIKAVVLTNL